MAIPRWISDSTRGFVTPQHPRSATPTPRLLSNPAPSALENYRVIVRSHPAI